MDPENAIEVRNVSKHYTISVRDPDKTGTILKPVPTKKEQHGVINDVSFNIKKGEVVGIIGRNGSGKSTMLSMIARILEPDSGTIEISGKVASIMELGMGFHADMSGRENIYLKGELYGFSKKDMDARIDRIIDYSGLGSYIDNPVRTYSSGMSGRLAFAIMVNVESEIMLVDEVLSIGDASFQSKAKTHFKKLASSGKTVVIVSHNTVTLEQMCTRILWIENGKIAKDGNPKTICSMYTNKIASDPEIISDLAHDGVAEAQYKLAMMYKDGQPFGKDDEAYTSWLAKSAQQGYAEAQVAYGDQLLASSDTNQPAALEFYRSAADKGNTEARSRLAGFSDTGSLREKLYGVFERMGNVDDPIFQYRTGDFLLKAAWSQGEREKAFELMQKSAEHGYPAAQYQLALMHRDGIGSAKDVGKTIEWLKVAADNGHMQAIQLLADTFFTGKLVPRNDEEAYRYYLLGAEMGNAKCQYQTAVMLRDGIGTDASKTESDRWFTSYSHTLIGQSVMWAGEYIKANEFDKELLRELYSSLEGNTDALWNLLLIELVGHTDDSKIDEIIEKMERLSSEGKIDATKRLIEYYSHIAMEREESRIIPLLKKTIDHRHVAGILQLAQMKLRNKGIASEQSAECLLNELATYGNVNAMTELIKSLQKDRDDTKLQTVINMLENLADSGSLSAIRALQSLQITKEGNETARFSSIDLITNAAKLGDVRSRETLAKYYRDGTGVERDDSISKHWFDSARQFI